MAKTTNQATLLGFVAILLWALLALFTTYTEGIPPFELLALTFLVASIGSASILLLQPTNWSLVCRQPWYLWVFGTLGLFGYHAFYFIALKNAPAAEASIIAYLWPLLIVLFSTLLPNERFHRGHLIGAILGFSGAVLLIVSKNAGISISPANLDGYLAALACALIWSSYSVLNRRFDKAPTAAVLGFCIFTTILAFITSSVTETWVTPNLSQWLAILGLGLGPVGLAFFVWDIGTKRGNIQLLGTLAYSAPLLSTVFLVMFGQAENRWQLWLAALCIVSGALIAAKAKPKIPPAP